MISFTVDISICLINYMLYLSGIRRTRPVEVLIASTGKLRKSQETYIATFYEKLDRIRQMSEIQSTQHLTVVPPIRSDDEVENLLRLNKEGWAALESIAANGSNEDLQIGLYHSIELLKHDNASKQQLELIIRLLARIRESSSLGPAGVALLLNGTIAVIKKSENQADRMLCEGLTKFSGDRLKKFIASRKFPVPEVTSVLRTLLTLEQLLPSFDKATLIAICKSIIETIDERVSTAQMPGSDKSLVKKIADAPCLAALFSVIGELGSPALPKIHSVYNLISIGLPETTSPAEAAHLGEAIASAGVGTSDVYNRILEICMTSSVELLTPSILKKLKMIEICLRIDIPDVLSNLNSSSSEYLIAIREADLIVDSRIMYYAFHPELEKETIIGSFPNIAEYQISRILQTEFHVPIMPSVVGPYHLSLTDRNERIVWLVSKGKQNKTMETHLEGLGWRIRRFDVKQWIQLKTKEAKINAVRSDLKQASLLDS